MASPSINSAEIAVYHQNTPSSDTPDKILTDVIQSVSIASRASDIADEMSIDIRDLNNNSSDLRMGDRIEFSATISSGPTGYGLNYGEDYGAGGTGGLSINWTGRVKAPEVSRDHRGVIGSTVSTDGTDWIAGILQERNISGSWVNEDIGFIIRDICNRKASEIDVTNVSDLGVTTDLFPQNENAWDTIVGLSARADALITQQGTQLRVDPITDLPYAFDLTADDYFYPWNTSTDDTVKNVIRVDSGSSRQQEATQTNQTSWQRVTQDSRLTHRLRARKSEIHSVDLYVRAVSDEDLIVRLQADEGGEPVAIGDTDSDIDSTRWSSSNIPDGDWKAFFFNNHTLPDRDPWLIIETGGDTGHDVGVDDSGVPAYQSFYPHPMSFEDSDTDSIDEYGPRELQVDRDNLDTITATRDAVRQELARRAWPSKTITFKARSPRAHALEPGDVIGVDNPDEDAVGDFIVHEVNHTFDAETVDLQTDISATWRKGILAPQ